MFDAIFRRAALLAIATVAIAVPAQSGSPRVDNRQARQDARIDAGIASGRINPSEAARLRGQQARIDRAEDRMLADGRLSARDRVRLAARQDVASGAIARKRHNRR